MSSYISSLYIYFPLCTYGKRQVVCIHSVLMSNLSQAAVGYLVGLVHFLYPGHHEPIDFLGSIEPFEQSIFDVWPLVAARLRKRLWVPMVLDSLQFDLFVGLRTRDRTIGFDCGAASLNIPWAYVEDVHKKLEASWRTHWQASSYQLFSLRRVSTGCNQRVPWHRGYDPLSILLRCQCRSLRGGRNANSLRLIDYCRKNNETQQDPWDTFKVKAVTKR